jgi:hypothetical protein
MLPIRWYCPPGVAKPAHAVIPGVCQCLPTGGPPGAVPGGVCYGGAIEPDEIHGWHQHPAGHWFNFHDSAPALLIRLDTNPRLVRWIEVAGADPAHIWRVPVLMEPVYGEDGQTPQLFKSALDRIWTGEAWNATESVQDLQRRLMMVCHALGTDRASLSSEEAVRAALDVLRQGHEFDPLEVVKAGWISEVLVVRTLVAACGMELGA